MVWYCALERRFLSLVLIIAFSTINIFTPPKKLKRSWYRCDKRFHLDNILEMYNEEVNFGILLVSGSTSVCYKIVKTGKHIDGSAVSDISTRLQKRQRKGGQSALRYSRIRAEKENVYINKIVDMAITHYMSEDKTECHIVGLVIAGPASLKIKVSKHRLIRSYLGDKILKIVNIPTIDDTSVWTVYDMCRSEFANAEDREALEYISQLQDMIRNADQKLVYGIDNIMEQISMYMLQSLIIPKNTPEDIKRILKERAEYGCKIIEARPSLLNTLVVNCIGIKWY